jgi:hypothetical protein
MVRQNLVVVTGPSAGAALSHTGPVVGHIKMPVYQFAIKWDDNQSPDVRYTHLADEEAARRYAKFLIHELASSGFYSSRPCLLEAKDESGPLFSMPFRETAT